MMDVHNKAAWDIELWAAIVGATVDTNRILPS